MQLRKIRWSDFRNSHACCMQISGAAGHYTHKLLHRRASPRTICSLSCSCSLGRINHCFRAPFLCTAHFLGHSGVQPLQLLPRLFSSLLDCNLALSSLCCHLWVALRNQIVEAWSHTPVCLAPRAHCRIVTLAGDVFIRCDNLPRTCTFPYKDTYNNNKQIVPTSR